MSYHHINPTNMVCSCGRTKEQHIMINLMNDKWKMNNGEGKVDVEKMFKEIDEVTKI